MAEFLNKKEGGGGENEDDSVTLPYTDPMIDPENRAIVYTKKEDFIGVYEGWTEPKTLLNIGKAVGRFLFIDEIYRFGQDGGGYGIQAVNTLLAEMTEWGNKLGVIGAGYEQDIEKYFFDLNPGFRSRFPNKMEFKNYTPPELAKIFMISLYDDRNPMAGLFTMVSAGIPTNLLKTYKQTLSKNVKIEASQIRAELISFFVKNLDRFKESNARDVKTLADLTIKTVVGNFSFDNVKKDVDTSALPWELTIKDVEAAFKLIEKKDVGPSTKDILITSGQKDEIDEDMNRLSDKQEELISTIEELQQDLEALTKSKTSKASALQMSVIQLRLDNAKRDLSDVEKHIQETEDKFLHYQEMGGKHTREPVQSNNMPRKMAKAASKFASGHDHEDRLASVTLYKVSGDYDIHGKGFIRESPKCHPCNRDNPLYVCDGCHSVFYCSTLCQKKDWSIHQLFCGFK